MNATRVVNVRSGEPYDVYVGRAVPRRRLGRSKWGNPFVLGRNPTEDGRNDAIATYQAWLMQQADLLAAIPELRGKVLGCWCFPLACHGDVLAALADGRSYP